MTVKEKFEELNKDPKAIYYYIVGIVAVLFVLGFIADPKAMGSTVGMIIGIIFWLAMCYFCYKFFFRSPRYQQQQQQQQVVVQTGDNKKMRVCPKCGMQNDVASKFCADCSYEFGRKCE